MFAGTLARHVLPGVKHVCGTVKAQCLLASGGAARNLCSKSQSCTSGRCARLAAALAKPTRPLAPTSAVCGKQTTADKGNRYVGSSSAASGVAQAEEIKTKSDGDVRVAQVEQVDRKVILKWQDGQTTKVPMVWLRDNCQCPECFNSVALGRSFTMEKLDNPTPASLKTNADGGIDITWLNGHQSSFTGQWLNVRSFTEKARRVYREKYHLPREVWSKDHKISRFDFSSLMENDRSLLSWLEELERRGAVLVVNTPPREEAAYELSERVAAVMYTHFGIYSNVINHPTPNNLAYTNSKLNLHNDMPQYHNIPGLIFLHIIKQHDGVGGDTVVSDGLMAAEAMRQQHPDAFRVLTDTDVYFWDKGDAKCDLEMKQFYKIEKAPIIEVDNSGTVTTIRFNNQVRDSFLDLPEDNVESLYDAMKIYFDLMYENSIKFKMQSGEMTVLDNERCQHGREAFIGQSARHLVTTFMSRDEALCRRRRLQEVLGPN